MEKLKEESKYERFMPTLKGSSSYELEGLVQTKKVPFRIVCMHRPTCGLLLLDIPEEGRRLDGGGEADNIFDSK
ncbi:Interleukin-17 receptor E [Manis javanica]|nr:Interleukin-17 receptor E [Manis javanica]